ncbi:SNF2 family DNA-dependent ATPase domain-containing protein, partial [Zymoseptoria tritici IPO323]
TLKHYQVLGVAFMRRRENGTSEPRGGILADEMGLGKTIQMIANIINGKPDKRAEEKCTLIIASPALISQWYDEILKFTQFKKTKKNKDDGNDKSKHGLGAVIQHRAKHRIPGSEKQIIATIKKASVCLTTWGEVNKSYPKAVCPRELTTAGQKSEWWRNHFNEEKGIFHKIKFHRIVLDEAQHIKNHTGHASMACRALLANHYWAISGTPLMNGVKEMYAYLRFIRYPNAGSFKLFSENFCSREDPNGSEKLGVILRQFVIRRTHADTLFKAKLLDLPPPTQRVLYLEFNEVERSVYEIVKNRFIQRINAMNRREGVKSGYNHIWTMLLRLRQLCAHPLLIQDTILDLLEREDFEKLNQITEDTSDDSEETTGILSHLKHRCSSCRNPPAEPHITSCFHIYCHQCLMTIQHGAARQGKDHARCLECGAEFQSVKMLDERIVENQPPAANGKTKKKKKDARPQLNWIGLNGEVLPSAKTIAAKAQILEWLSSDPTAKIIIYTQFIPMVTILAKVCETEGWGYCKYTGGMSLDAREKSIREFSRNDGEKGDEEDDDQDDEPEPKRILIASLKAGGLGLNIVAASRVIMLDPWWNDAVEQQAFCRVFRIGQVKETQLTRFCVKNTIDAAMFQVKERKIDEIEKVME